MGNLFNKDTSLINKCGLSLIERLYIHPAKNFLQDLTKIL